MSDISDFPKPPASWKTDTKLSLPCLHTLRSSLDLPLADVNPGHSRRGDDNVPKADFDGSRINFSLNNFSFVPLRWCRCDDASCAVFILLGVVRFFWCFRFGELFFFLCLMLFEQFFADAQCIFACQCRSLFQVNDDVVAGRNVCSELFSQGRSQKEMSGTGLGFRGVHWFGVFIDLVGIL